MSNVFDFENYGDAAIEIKRSKEFFSAADVLSEFIACLALPAEKNNKLIELIMNQITIHGKDTYLQGFEMGFMVGQGAAEGKL